MGAAVVGIAGDAVFGGCSTVLFGVADVVGGGALMGCGGLFVRITRSFVAFGSGMVRLTSPFVGLVSALGRKLGVAAPRSCTSLQGGLANP